MNRIMVIGCGGSGKTTLSIKLHEITGIKLIHLDKYYWKPNWVETEKEEWENKVKLLSKEASWIIDGNYGGTMEIRLRKADTIIFMDRSRWLCIYRVLKRVMINYGRTRKDMGEACKERFSWGFIKYIYGYNRTRKPQILEKLDKMKSGKEIVVLRNRKEVKGYLVEMKKRHAT